MVSSISLFLDQPLDLHGFRAVLSSLGRYHRLDSCVVCGLYLCVGHLNAVFTPSRHCFYSTENIFYFFAACPIFPSKVSHYYQPTSVDTASVHVAKGITKNIHKTPEDCLLRQQKLGRCGKQLQPQPQISGRDHRPIFQSIIRRCCDDVTAYSTEPMTAFESNISAPASLSAPFAESLLSAQPSSISSSSLSFASSSRRLLVNDDAALHRRLIGSRGFQHPSKTSGGTLPSHR